MPLLTVGYPTEKYNTEENLTEVRNVLSETIDQLRYILCNLDTGNVVEAASVKAQNIDASQAKILDAQIGSLTADKIYTGTLDSGKVTISDENKGRKVTMAGSYIHFTENGADRAGIGYLSNGMFVFYINDESGEQTKIGLDSNGNAYISGTIDSSTIYASNMIGATKSNFENRNKDKVFAKVDLAGISIMQDKDGARKQKIGMTADSRGDAILVLGAGNGSGQVTINGVTYSDDSFVVTKGDGVTVMNLKGANSSVAFYNNSSGQYVTVDGIKVTDLQSRIASLERRVSSLESSAG